MTTGSDVPGCKPLGLPLPILCSPDHDGSPQQQIGKQFSIDYQTPNKQYNSDFLDLNIKFYSPIRLLGYAV